MTNVTNPTGIRGLFRSVVGAWDRFWFTPAAPTPLGLIRLCAGIIVLYTVVAQTWDLYELYGPNGWIDMEMRQEVVHNQPILAPGFGWEDFQPPGQAVTPKQQEYAKE